MKMTMNWAAAVVVLACAATAAPASAGWTQLPRSGYGFKTHASADRQWGQARTINGLIVLGRYYNYIAGRGHCDYGEISLYGGGYMYPHSSHRNGTDVDMSMMNHDGWAQPGLTIYSGAYSRYYTSKLVWCMRTMREWNVRTLLFNDTAVGGVQWYQNHHHHLHLGIY